MWQQVAEHHILLIIDESQVFLQNPEIGTETGRAVKN